MRHTDFLYGALRRNPEVTNFLKCVFVTSLYLTCNVSLLVCMVGSNLANEFEKEILNEHVDGPFMVNLGENAIFMHDNARPHTYWIVSDYLQEMNITRMEWPARSPDVNPIEHAWD